MPSFKGTKAVEQAISAGVKITGITKYNGVHLEKKYMPIVHPNMAIVKPQMEDEIKKRIDLDSNYR